MADAKFTHARLKELLTYVPETGEFVSRTARRNVRIGDCVGHDNGAGYTLIRIAGHRGYAHRLAFLFMTGEWPHGDVDHINGDGKDNRWSNLRDVKTVVNLQNYRKARTDNKCGLLGVCPNGKRWMALIRVNGARAYLGTFDTPEEAHAAYLMAKRDLHEGCTI